MSASAALLSSPRPAPSGLYRNVWRYAAGARGNLLTGLALLLGSQLLGLLVPWLAGRAIDVLQQGGPDFLLHAAAWIATLLLVHLGTWGLHGPGRMLERSAGVQVRQNVAEALFDKLLKVPMSWHDRHHSGDVQQRVTQASGALSEFTQNQYIYLSGAIRFFGPLAALVMLAPVTGLAAVVGYGLVAAASLRFDRILMRLAERQNDAERRYGAGLLDVIGNIATVVGLRLQGHVQRLLARRLEAVFEPMRLSIGLNEAKWCVVDVVTMSITWCLVLGYVWTMRGAGTGLMIGGVFMVYQYGQQSGGVVASMAGNFQQLARYRVNFASADMVWDAPLRAQAGHSVAAGWQRIEVRDICFAHAADADRPGGRGRGLQHANLVLERGRRIALVGPSGSGKSTLLRVLSGLYEADHGHLTVDGVAHLGILPLAAVTTLIPQEADVFEASVLENIAFDATPASADLTVALETSAFDGVLETMPQGLATPIAERGFNLSGGQRQRLCLARGFLAARDSSLVLLDEPTSALDPLSEARVFERLRANFADACVVASVHRMSLLEHFDTVVLMMDGRVIDAGSVAELMARQPVFEAMVGAQADADEGSVAQAA